MLHNCELYFYFFILVIFDYLGVMDKSFLISWFLFFVGLLQDGLAVVADAPVATPGKKEKKKEGKTSEKKGKGKDADNGNGDANAADNQDNNHDGPKSPPVVCIHIS